MIAVDTSALVAIVLGEPDAEALATVMARHQTAIAATCLLEGTMVLESRAGPDAARDLASLLDLYATRIEPVDADLARLGHAAWRRFGKGRHPAGLDFGDCFSYALAKSLAVPLLFKGEDFLQTDVSLAV